MFFIKTTTFYLLFIFNFILTSFQYKSIPFPTLSQSAFTILNIIPHNKTTYTQGLILSDNSDTLYESGGLYHKSTITKLKYPSMEVLSRDTHISQYFAEGIAVCNNRIYQLTWRENKIFTYTFPDMQYIKTISLPLEMKEGWGLSSAQNPNELYATDGSNNVYLYSCEDENKLRFINKINVTNSQNEKINRLNDIIYAEGYLWINVYMKALILKVDPISGKIIKEYDMNSLVNYEIDNNMITKQDYKRGDVLNGICYNKLDKSFLVTGKRWGYLYEIKFN